MDVGGWGSHFLTPFRPELGLGMDSVLGVKSEVVANDIGIDFMKQSRGALKRHLAISIGIGIVVIVIVILGGRDEVRTLPRAAGGDAFVFSCV